MLDSAIVACSPAVHLDLEADADRLVAAIHVEDLAMNSRIIALRVTEEDGTWIRTLIGDQDRAYWHKAS